MNIIKPKDDKGFMLSFLTDTILVLIAIFGSYYYTGLIGALVLFGWLLLELRRAGLRKKLRPLIVYPAIKLQWVIVLVLLGMISFLIAVAYGYGFFKAVGYLVLLVWWFVSLRVYRYYSGRARVGKIGPSEKVVVKGRAVRKKAKKKVVKKKAVRKKVVKKKAKKK